MNFQWRPKKSKTNILKFLAFISLQNKTISTSYSGTKYVVSQKACTSWQMECKSIYCKKINSNKSAHRSNENPKWESMTHLMEQLVAHDPSHQKRKILEPRFSEPEMVFPIDVEAKELQSCSTFSLTEIHFR